MPGMNDNEVTQDTLDAEVLSLLQANAPGAAERLIDVFGDRVYGLALRILGSEEDAKEAVQETFITVWRKWPTFRGQSKFSSWVYRIAANHAYMKLRKKRRRSGEMSLEQLIMGASGSREGIVESEAAAGTRPRNLAPDEELQKQETRRLIDEAIRSLSDTYRTAYMLKEVDGLSLREIADAMELTEPAVKSRVHRARLTVRKQLERYLR